MKCTQNHSVYSSALTALLIILYYIRPQLRNCSLHRRSWHNDTCTVLHNDNIYLYNRGTHPLIAVKFGVSRYYIITRRLTTATENTFGIWIGKNCKEKSLLSTQLILYNWTNSTYTLYMFKVLVNRKTENQRGNCVLRKSGIIIV